MKVLYIGHYKDPTGWGSACANNIIAMDEAGIDVVARAITYENQDSTYSDRIKPLEQKGHKDCDFVVQHTLPINYCYNSDYKKNIGYLAVESADFSTTGWARNCNMMDEMWVPSEETKQSLVRSGVNVPIQIVPHSVDVQVIQGSPEGEKIDALENCFTFGFFGEFIERKNVKALLKAFHMAFSPLEPVNLFIKTSKADLDKVQNYAKFVRDGLKLRRRYKEEVIVTGMLPQRDYISVMRQVNCFVMPSRGEAFCIPSLEAMCLGIPSIYTEGIGMGHTVGASVKSHDVPCFGAVDTLEKLDTAWTTWKEIDVIDLAKTMRTMYEELSIDEIRQDTLNCCKVKSENYTHKAIGRTMKEILK